MPRTIVVDLDKYSKRNIRIKHDIAAITSVPPAEDSPKNIVNILNDDCIQAILRKLTIAGDFLAAAEVCKRFQDNAKLCFPYKKVQFTYCDPWCHDEVHFDSAEQFLSIFSPLIKTASCNLSQDHIYRSKYDGHFELFQRYCFNTLIELDFRVNQYKAKFWYPFTALKKLKLYSEFVSIPNSFGTPAFPELIDLEMSQVKDISCFINNCPKLQLAYFTDNIRCSNGEFIDFQNAHPLLETLWVNECYMIDASVWAGVENRMPNIATLYLGEGKYYGPEIMSFSKLKNLKSLTMKLNFVVSISLLKDLIATLVKNNQPIEEIGIRFLELDLAVELNKIKTLKKLTIYLTPEQMVVDAIRKFSSIEYICIVAEYRAQIISMESVVEILKHCKELKNLIIFNLGMEFDLNLYNTVVALATDRVEVRISCTQLFEKDPIPQGIGLHKWAQIERRLWHPFKLSRFYKHRMV